MKEQSSTFLFDLLFAVVINIIGYLLYLILGEMTFLAPTILFIVLQIVLIKIKGWSFINFKQPMFSILFLIGMCVLLTLSLKTTIGNGELDGFQLLGPTISAMINGVGILISGIIITSIAQYKR